MGDILPTLTAIFCVVGFLPYTVAILKGAKPSKATWIVWASLDVITLIGMWMKDTQNAQIITSSAGATLIAILSLWYGIPGWKLGDKACLLVGVIGAIFLIFGSPIWGIVASLTAIIIASWPTFESAYKSPQEENKWAWLLFFLAAVLSVVSIPKWTWEDALQPLVFLAIESVMMYLVWIRPFRTKKP